MNVHLVHFVRLALDLTLDRVVAGIQDPPADTQLVGLGFGVLETVMSVQDRAPERRKRACLFV